METYFERLSESFLDFFVFGGESISKRLHRLGNYHLLEPERVRLGTMCGMTLWQPLERTSYGAFFDLKACGDAFYFNNVIRYVNEILEEVKTLAVDKMYLQEIAVGATSVILAAELCKLRMGEEIGEEKARALISLIETLKGEFEALWKAQNYEEGVRSFLGILDARQAELCRLFAA